MIAKSLVWAAAVACVWSARAGKLPSSGDYVELHSCEVYTGGCTASSQATLGGRSLLRIWAFEKAGARSLPLAVLETAEANLAFPETKPVAAVAYLPLEATEGQRREMMGWLKARGVDATRIRVVPLSFMREGGHVVFRGGESLALETRAIEHCDAGSCGEQLWYTPRGASGCFTVLVNERSAVSEPLVHLTWRDNAAKSVFLSKFGEKKEAEFTLAAIP